MWWNKLGFQKTPYFGDELDVTADSYQLFVGREDEARSIAFDMSESDRAVICIGGISGSGKTSFINHCQYKSYNQIASKDDIAMPKLLPCIAKVQLHEEEEFPLVLTKILSSLVASFLQHCQIVNTKPPDKVMQIKNAIDSAVADNSGWGAGVSILGTGGNINKSAGETYNETSFSRETSLIAMINEVVEVSVNDYDFKGVGIVINNIETLTDDYIIKLVDYCRDTLFTLKNVWWYLLGPQNLGKLIETRAPRLRGFLTGPGVDLDPLNSSSVLQILELRRKSLAIRPDASLPINDRVVELLYKASSGDLRFMFNVCSNIVRLAVKEFPSINLTEQLALKAISRLTYEHLHYSLESPDTSLFLKPWLVGKFDSAKASDYRKFSFDDKDKFSNSLDELTKRQLLWRDSDSAGNYIYTPRGYLQLGIIADLGTQL